MIKETDIHPHVPAERAELFRTDPDGSGGATEEEYLILLYALVRASKPNLVLETGSYTGAGTLALAEAIRENGFGKLISLETDGNRVDAVRAKVAGYPVEVLQFNSLGYLKNQATNGIKFDFTFLDSHLPIRCDELSALMEYELLVPNALVCIHDTSRLRTMPAGQRCQESVEFWEKFEKLRPRLRDVFEFPLSRGMLLIRP